MGSLSHIKDFDCVIILDDDHIYQKDIFEIFINEFKKIKIILVIMFKRYLN